MLAEKPSRKKEGIRRDAACSGGNIKALLEIHITSNYSCSIKG